MANHADITPDICRKLVQYDPVTGKFWWRERGIEWFADRRSCSTWNGKYAGKPAFWVLTEDGYCKGTLLRRAIRASRLAWAISYGAWPAGEVDHINGIKTDNRLENLRDVPRAVNARNRARRIDNRSGYNGIRFDRNVEKWRVCIRGHGTDVHLGMYTDLNEAIAARDRASAKYGYSKRHGSPS